jgi:hypothetical protein
MNPALHSHTHCQVAPADTQAKIWQRVRLHYLTEEKRNNEGTTRNIRKPGDVGKFNFCTFIQNHNGLTSWSFEIPASAYCHRYKQAEEKKQRQNHNEIFAA